MLRAVLFDLGGTLDGDGEGWLDRFVRAYADAGLALPRPAIRDAFDEAERRASADETIGAACLDVMLARHVGWQLDRLAIADGGLARRIAALFAASVRATSARSRHVLAALAARGLRQGVVSNGCGNVDVLCDELGFSPYLSLTVDSRRVGLWKPDPAIFVHAAEALGLPAASIMMVGDSLERDVLPARSVGMRTGWVEGPRGRSHPDATPADVYLRSLAELPGAVERFCAEARATA